MIQPHAPCWKMGFESKAEALRRIGTLNARGRRTRQGLTVYRCPDADEWHHTSNTQWRGEK